MTELRAVCRGSLRALQLPSPDPSLLQLPSGVAWYARINPMYYAFTAAVKSEMAARGADGAATAAVYGVTSVDVARSLGLVWVAAAVYGMLLVCALSWTRMGRR